MEIKKGQSWSNIHNGYVIIVDEVTDTHVHAVGGVGTDIESFKANWILDGEKERGLRYNNGKTKWSLMDFDTLEGALKVFEFGTEKYGVDNWKKGLKTTEICESLMRHLVSYLNCDDIDKETNLPHVDHILCNAIMLAYTNKFNKEFDTRRLDKNKKCCGNWDSEGNCKCKQ